MEHSEYSKNLYKFLELTARREEIWDQLRRGPVTTKRWGRLGYRYGRISKKMVKFAVLVDDYVMNSTVTRGG